jgi:hypothetical protein
VTCSGIAQYPAVPGMVRPCPSVLAGALCPPSPATKLKHEGGQTITNVYGYSLEQPAPHSGPQRLLQPAFHMAAWGVQLCGGWPGGWAGPQWLARSGWVLASVRHPGLAQLPCHVGTHTYKIAGGPGWREQRDTHPRSTKHTPSPFSM